MTLRLLYQDEYLVAIDKPSGLLVHRSWLDRHETQFAMQMTRDLIGQHVYPVHRLDRPTSGVLLFALDPQTARTLSEDFAQHRVQKEYLALVRGWTPEQLFIDYPLKEELDKIADKFATVDKPAQEAQTQLQRLQTVELPYAVSAKHPTSRYSLVRLMPHTGRKHQLRRHMAHIFHPIVGDTKHGDGRHNRLFREQYDCQRLMLCNLSLTIQHPQLQSPLRIQTELDAQWQQLFAQFGWC
ncbi:MAG: tRNA pseudouridine(65) synthase TruC [Aeromonadaceae bacterium]|nr:tRNA pseudouridine(65) synthase TruC [Aeromonadaceae bacterium]MBP8127668.1 tRNA pseudouridine(65) synthase TruC [Aeromonadaceae bacterium]